MMGSRGAVARSPRRRLTSRPGSYDPQNSSQATVQSLSGPFCRLGDRISVIAKAPTSNPGAAKLGAGSIFGEASMPWLIRIVCWWNGLLPAIYRRIPSNHPEMRFGRVPVESRRQSGIPRHRTTGRDRRCAAPERECPRTPWPCTALPPGASCRSAAYQPPGLGSPHPP